ncbi:glutelin [Musa troglodytarum]|uniref:Glutelin n=1 Tax=Musa troglodytarum TaxID=320322 RepID=A0A9E7KPF3_9LILI|nr:glutelin [Musa troglodytarum]
MATSASVVLSFSLCLLLLCHISRAQLGLGQLGAAMATSASVVLSFSLCLLLLCHISRAQLGLGQLGAGEPCARPLGLVSQCRIERLSALEPTRRVPSEAGFTEYFDQFNEQLQCAGVAVRRRTIQPRGLLLPSFSSAPRLVYIMQAPLSSPDVCPRKLATQSTLTSSMSSSSVWVWLQVVVPSNREAFSCQPFPVHRASSILKGNHWNSVPWLPRDVPILPANRTTMGAAMAASASVVLSFSLCLLLLCHISRAQLGLGQLGAGEPCARPLGLVSQCRIERLSALEPTRRVPSEAGFTEYFDQFNEQLQCAGVAVRRRTIQPRGLLLPSFSSAPRLVYIMQAARRSMVNAGRGIIGTVIPGCPETFQSFQQTEQQWEQGTGECRRFRDEHQRIHYFREGDIIALPAGVAYWSYNNGEAAVVAITTFDTSSSANQLDRQHREFLLAGRERLVEQGSQIEVRLPQIKGNNLLSGFELDPLAEALGVDRELVRKIQNPDDTRGEIVLVTSGLQVLQASRQSEQLAREREVRQECQEGRGCQSNVLEAYCTMKIRQNIGDPSRADYFNPRAGRITTLNSQKLPILRFVQMSAVRALLRPNAIRSPHWNVNAHSIVYALRGYSRVQVVGHRGQTVFVGELRQGQLLVVPQYFAMMFQAQRETFEWVSIKTNDNAMVNHFVGKTSALRGMPVEVLMNSYCISREEAMQLKFNRGNELALFTSKIEREAIRTSV